MPTPLTHALIPLVLGHTVTDRKLPLKFWFLAVLCSVFPDLDVIGFRFGVSYGDFFGHRGFFHSLFFAFLLSSTVMLLAFRKPTMFSKKWWLIWLFFFGVSGSHGILDAFTNGGLGIALLSPFNTTRYFFPWRPFVVAPWGIRAFFSPWGKEVLLSELYWIWLPLVFAFIIAKAYRRIKLVNYDKTRKAECQSVELAKNIFKWLFVVLLIILLIGGFFFQAPWKVTALLVVFLLAHTVLPRIGLKWFWAGVGVVVLALVIWVFLPEDDTDWRPYTFGEELAALEAKYAIPDEKNAARIYNELLESYDSNSFYDGLEEGEVDKIPMREPWLSEGHPQIATWVEGHQTTMSKLLSAAAMEECRFPINADPFSLDDTMDRLPLMRTWAYLLISAVSNDMAEVRSGEGLKKLVTVLQMGKHQRQQASLVEFLVGVAIEALAIDQFKRFIVTGDATEEDLAAIEKTLGAIKYDWSTDFPRFIEYEKLLHKNFLGMFYVVNPEGRIRLNPGVAMRAMIAQLPEDAKEEIRDKARLRYWRRKLMKAHTILAWFYMPSTPQKAAEIIDASFARYDAMAEPDFDWQKEPQKPAKIFRLNYTYLVEHLTEVLAPAYQKIHEVYLRVKSDKRGGRIMVALRRYKNKTGHWPQSLDEVLDLVPEEIFIDPINGGLFVYKLSDENFTLYSRGKNNIDDGGEWDTNAGADDWLIWPKRRRSCEPEEESADDEKQ